MWFFFITYTKYEKKIGCDTYIPNNGSNITNGGGKRKNTKNKRKANKKSKRSKSK